MIVLKRLYIYTLAILVVIIASIRGATYDSPNLGTRIINLTREILFPFYYYNGGGTMNSSDSDNDTRFQQMEIIK